MDRLLLIFEPTIYIPREVMAGVSTETREQIKEFRRERSAKTINRELNKLFDAWMESLFFGTTESRRDFRCFSIGDGIDATFTLSRITAFSRRL